MPSNPATQIHPTAVIEDGASIGAGVQIGPYSLIGPHVALDDGCRIHGHVSISGRTKIGPGTEIYPFASVGSPPQDLKYKGEPSELTIGAKTVIREHVTLNPGTEGGGMITRVGDGCLLMVGAHVGHDSQVGNQVIMANNATLGGHVQVGDRPSSGGSVRCISSSASAAGPWSAA